MVSARSHQPRTRMDASPPGYFTRRLRQGARAESVLLRRRRRIATCLACITAAIAFFGLYVLSWVFVLDM